MEITKLFPSPLYTNDIDITDDFTNILFQDCGNGHISKSLDILKHFPDTKQKIEQNVNAFVQKLGYKTRCKVTNSWVNKHYRGGWAQPHYHANAILSGVVFINTPPNSGIFKLIKPSPTSHTIFSTVFQLDREKDAPHTHYTADHYAIEPITNTIIIFPSTLIHQVSPSETDEARYTLAFDVLPAEDLLCGTMSYYATPQ